MRLLPTLHQLPHAMRVFRRYFSLLLAPVAFVGCAPKTQAPLPGAEFLRALQQRSATREGQTVETSATFSGPPQAVYVDVMAIARRLPAWQLAEKLDKSSRAINFSEISAPNKPRNLNLQSAPLEKSSGNLPLPAGEDNEVVTGAPGYNRPSQRVVARDALHLENQAKERQEGTLESFLSDVQRRQNANRADDRVQLRAELEDEIEASQRLALANLEPLLPPPAIQLEMTNLRIQLLPNSPANDEEKKQAQARLTKLEAQWRAQLQAQAETRFEELRRLLTEVPVEKRTAGLKEIEQTLNERGLRDENLRKLVAGSLHDRISAGFGVDDTAPLFIQLPNAELSPQTLGKMPVLVAQAPNYRINKQFNSNTTLFWPSVSTFDKTANSTVFSDSAPVSSVPPRGATVLTNSHKRAALLRQQALREATQWAKVVARRRHWVLQNQRTPITTKNAAQNVSRHVPDRTGEALQLLNL